MSMAMEDSKNVAGTRLSCTNSECGCELREGTATQPKTSDPMPTGFGEERAHSVQRETTFE